MSIPPEVNRVHHCLSAEFSALKISSMPIRCMGVVAQTCSSQGLFPLQRESYSAEERHESSCGVFCLMARSVHLLVYSYFLQ